MNNFMDTVKMEGLKLFLFLEIYNLILHALIYLSCMA